ncbi:MAG: hypothetical protein RR585_12195, partial [Coprobacillus sp.]
MEKYSDKNAIGSPEVLLALEINDEGKFQYVWSVYDADKQDYLALYENDTVSYKNYIKKSKENGGTMGFKITGVSARRQVELRYLSYNSHTRSYDCRYKTSAFPDIVFSSSTNNLQLIVSDGKIKVAYDITCHTDRDWIGIYPKGANPDDDSGYVKYEWVNTKDKYVLFDLAYFKSGLTARYYREVGDYYSRKWKKVAETSPVELIKAFYDKTVTRTRIDDQNYNSLKQQFPQLNQWSTYITAEYTKHY